MILAWLKSDGEEVTRGEPLVEIESDKASTVYEAPHQGTLTILRREGETLSVGTVIAVIGEAAKPAAGQDGAAGSAGNGQAPSGLAPPPRAATGHRVKASPLARRIARERGIRLEELTGSGPQNRITRADVEAAAGAATQAAAASPGAASTQAAAPTPSPDAAPATADAVKGEVEVVEPSRLQQVVARRMAEAKATIPEFILQREVDMEEAVSLREGLAAAGGPDQAVPSVNDLVIKASGLALRAHPAANATFSDGRVERYSRVNVGFAVAAPGSLVVPVVMDADKLPLGAIASRTRELSQRVRERTVTAPELGGATFTVSNLGMYGIDWLVPVINPPQAAILGVGRIEPRPVAHEGAIALRRRMSLTLVCDHRVLYGAEAAELLAEISACLEQPLRLVL